MNCTSSKFIAFTAGAVIGSFVTWKFLKTKYDKIAEEETRSIKEYYKNKYEPEDIENDEDDDEEDDIDDSEDDIPDRFSSGLKYVKPGITEYTNILMDKDYINEKKGDAEDINKPYVIEPDEYGEYREYEPISLMYYADGVLADGFTGDIVDDIDETVGADFATHFGEYEDDSVFIRNDMRKVDYEILMDVRRYDDVFGESHPHDDE